MTRHRQLYQEYPEPGEEVVAQQLADYSRDVVVARKNFLSGTTDRDVHGKGIAALKAELIVDLGLPPEFRHGVFAHGGRRFPCWIRLSNGNQHPGKDSKPDVRGFAIKLMGVEGEKLLPEERWATTQDFLLFSGPIFFTATTEQFFDLIKSFNTNLLAILWFGLRNPRVLLATLRLFKRYGNLLEVKYWSTTPYRLGEIAVKYVIEPRSKERSAVPWRPARNYLRDRAAETLAKTDVLYDFFVQVQKDPYRQPIENALVEWKESQAPLQKVATIRIPRQPVDTPERNQVAENLAMNIFHCLPEHRPLGNVNRSRGLVYRTIADFRRRRNLVPAVEPTAGPDFFADPDADSGLADTSAQPLGWDTPAERGQLERRQTTDRRSGPGGAG